MVAIKKAELEELEQKHGLEEDGLTYQQRVSRITAYEKGEDWVKPEKPEPKRPLIKDIKESKWYGKKIIITPMMRPDAKRNLAFDEDLGPEMVVSEVNAGERIQGAPEDLDRMVSNYTIQKVFEDRRTYGKTTFPKIGTEISYTPGKDIVPVVTGNDGQKGYIWAMAPTTFYADEDTAFTVYGLRNIIEQLYPELLPRFSGKPVMRYVDALTLAADIPLTNAILKEHRSKVLQQQKLGLI